MLLNANCFRLKYLGTLLLYNWASCWDNNSWDVSCWVSYWVTYLLRISRWLSKIQRKWVRTDSFNQVFDKPLLDSGGVCLISLSAQRASKHDSYDGRHWLVEKNSSFIRRTLILLAMKILLKVWCSDILGLSVYLILYEFSVILFFSYL